MGKRAEMRAALEAIKGLEDNSVLMIKHGTPLATFEMIEELERAMKIIGHEGVLIAVVEDFDDLSVLDEQGMNQRGWYRRENGEDISDATDS